MESESFQDHLTRILEGGITVDAEETRQCDVVGCEADELEMSVL